MILIDAGPLVAVLDADDNHHQRCVDFLERTTEQRIIPAPVVVEVCQLAERSHDPRAEARFLRSLVAGEMTVEPIGHDDMARAAELVETYADLKLGFVDASTIALAERLNISTIATIDLRHFLVVRPRHVAAFTLVP